MHNCIQLLIVAAVNSLTVAIGLETGNLLSAIGVGKFKSSSAKESESLANGCLALSCLPLPSLSLPSIIFLSFMCFLHSRIQRLTITMTSIVVTRTTETVAAITAGLRLPGCGAATVIDIEDVGIEDGFKDGVVGIEDGVEVAAITEVDCCIWTVSRH